MRKRRRPKRDDWVLVVEGAGLVAPGVYPRKEVVGVLRHKGVRVRYYGDRKDALQAMAMLGLGPSLTKPPASPPSHYMAVVDGSYRDGHGSASAVLLDPRLEGKGAEVAVAQAAFPWASGPGDAEVRSWILALALAPKGGRMVLESDFLPLVEAWEGRGVHPGLERITRALKVLAEALGTSLEVRKAPRSRVERAHLGAGKAREDLPRKQALALQVRAVLAKLPARYRMAALNLLERYPGNEPLLEWLGRGESETRRLLLELLPSLDVAEQNALVWAVRTMPEALRQGLKEMDREEAWSSLPPTERQLAYLRSLGYSGPPPKTLGEASHLIEELRKEREEKQARG